MNLVAARYRPTRTNPRSCRVCGCTDEYGCDEGCAWVSSRDDLCTSCEAAKSHPVNQRTSVRFTYSACRCGWTLKTATLHHKKRARLIRAHWADVVGVDA